MTALQKILYTAQASATGGREGQAKTDDGKLDLMLTPPVEMGGSGKGVNPEQLFAAGYSACFLGAIKFVAKGEGVVIPDTASIAAAVSIGTLDHGFGIKADLNITLPGIDKAKAEDLVAKAHKVCPYSNATRGNVEVTLTVV